MAELQILMVLSHLIEIGIVGLAFQRIEQSDKVKERIPATSFIEIIGEPAQCSKSDECCSLAGELLLGRTFTGLRSLP